MCSAQQPEAARKRTASRVGLFFKTKTKATHTFW